MPRTRLPYILIPLAAFIAILPLIVQGCSCGHDFDFHILNWLEAARQFTHGSLHPHWAYTPAFNSGEPRFVFYPPLSWTLGAILGLILPWTWTPIAYTWLALTAAGLSLYYLAREFTAPTAATIAAVLYTVNPYMLFTAYERTAYAELLAAAIIPLLLHAILRGKDKGGVTIPRIAIPVALLWLTNAPAAVMSCYALALLTVIRLINPSTNNFSTSNFSSINPLHSGPSTQAVISTEGTRSFIASPAVEKPASPRLDSNSQTSLRIAFNTAAGTTLGFGLAALYILPAAYERRYVQIAMAITPFYRIQDNFLFHQTGDTPHDQVLHTASIIAVTLLTLTAVALTASFLRLSFAKRLRLTRPNELSTGKDASSRPERSASGEACPEPAEGTPAFCQDRPHSPSLSSRPSPSSLQPSPSSSPPSPNSSGPTPPNYPSSNSHGASSPSSPPSSPSPSPSYSPHSNSNPSQPHSSP